MINELCEQAHAAAVDKGFYERERELPELLMLVVSELAEAMEADRNSFWYEGDIKEMVSSLSTFSPYDFKDEVKDSVQDEIADAFIRLFDLCGRFHIDIDSHIKAKMLYNRTRPPKHDKKY
jgi:NTP pyrophosphatase (non-canonical NTP hydrolase)